MSRKVKLQDTGEFGINTQAYQAQNKKYYSSKEAYQKIARNAEYRAKCIDGMYALLEYKDFMKLPTYFYKRLSECEGYGYDVVYHCMKKKARDIQWAIHNKEFNSEVGKMQYIWAILNNYMNDALKQVVAERRAEEKKNKTSAVEESVNVDLEIPEVKQSTVNISKFLEDE